MENKQNLEGVELSDEQLNNVVGGYNAGQTIYLKSGTMHCTKRGVKCISTVTFLDKEGARLALVRLPCGYEYYISEGALRG